MPNPGPGGHVPDLVAAVDSVNRLLKHLETDMEQLLAELSGRWNEQPTHQGQLTGSRQLNILNRMKCLPDLACLLS